jgi:hypothetical protein
MSKGIFLAPFSYYVGKSKIAHLYPPPKFDTIIEPFAGVAAYAFRYWERDVIVNDLDPMTTAMWAFLTDPQAADFVERLVPAKVTVGMRVSEILPEDAPRGLVGLLQAEAVQGIQGTALRDKITACGVRQWNRALKYKLLEIVIPRVRHWRVSADHYKNLPNMAATWFVDPPYNNPAGAIYRTVDVNYEYLAEWCRTRTGQTIVCENVGATWLPFAHLTKANGFRPAAQQLRKPEAIWTNG